MLMQRFTSSFRDHGPIYDALLGDVRLESRISRVGGTVAFGTGVRDGVAVKRGRAP